MNGAVSSASEFTPCAKGEVAQGEKKYRFLGHGQWYDCLLKSLRRKRHRGLAIRDLGYKHRSGQMGVGAECENFYITYQPQQESMHHEETMKN